MTVCTIQYIYYINMSYLDVSRYNIELHLENQSLTLHILHIVSTSTRSQSLPLHRCQGALNITAEIWTLTWFGRRQLQRKSSQRVPWTKHSIWMYLGPGVWSSIPYWASPKNGTIKQCFGLPIPPGSQRNQTPWATWSTWEPCREVTAKSGPLGSAGYSPTVGLCSATCSY